jgi:hypothetical protein
LCLVTGDGLLAAAEGMRRSVAGRTFTLRTVVLVVVVVGLEAVATDTLRLVGAVPGDGESVLPPSREVDATARKALSSSQGSLFAVVRGVSFLRSGSGVGFDRVLDLSDVLSTLPSIVAFDLSPIFRSRYRAQGMQKRRGMPGWCGGGPKFDNRFDRWVEKAVC